MKTETRGKEPPADDPFPSIKGLAAAIEGSGEEEKRDRHARRHRKKSHLKKPARVKRRRKGK